MRLLSLAESVMTIYLGKEQPNANNLVILKLWLSSFRMAEAAM